MLVKEKPKTVRRVRHYFTLTPDCVSDLELAAFTYRRTTGEKTRPSHIVEKLVETNAIAKGMEAIKARRKELRQKANDRWEGITIHGQHKERYGVMLQPPLYRILLNRAKEAKTSVSELIEWTVREEGIKEMNRVLLGGEKDEQPQKKTK